MEYNRENLLKLLKFVKEIASSPGNEWFERDLLKMLAKSTSSNVVNTNPEIAEKINLILKYLAIDSIKVIDYSFFEEPSREHLFRDCLEMGRYEIGTPNHKKDFGEFCRYAHLQSEELINYFFNKSTDLDINKINRLIQDNNSRYKPEREPSEVHHIYYTHKLVAFKNISALQKKTSDVLWFLNDFRNELSHRNSLTNINEDKELQLFEQSGFTTSSIDFKKLNGNQRAIYNRGKHIITKRREEFGLIYQTLEDLKQRVVDNLPNKMIIVERGVPYSDKNPTLDTSKEET